MSVFQITNKGCYLGVCMLIVQAGYRLDLANHAKITFLSYTRKYRVYAH